MKVNGLTMKKSKITSCYSRPIALPDDLRKKKT